MDPVTIFSWNLVSPVCSLGVGSTTKWMVGRVGFGRRRESPVSDVVALFQKGLGGIEEGEKSENEERQAEEGKRRERREKQRRKLVVVVETKRVCVGERGRDGDRGGSGNKVGRANHGKSEMGKRGGSMVSPLHDIRMTRLEW